MFKLSVPLPVEMVLPFKVAVDRSDVWILLADKPRVEIPPKAVILPEERVTPFTVPERLKFPELSTVNLVTPDAEAVKRSPEFS